MLDWSRARGRLLLVMGTLGLGIAALEGFSAVALRLVEERWVGLAELQNARAETASGARGDALHRAASRAEPIREERILHPYLGYVMDPRLARRGVLRAGLDAESVELGFPRNRETVLQPADPKRAVIGLFGGSVADMLSSAGANALRRELAKAPALRGREIVIVSVAAPGYKQPQALMALNYLLVLGAHFDAIVNLDGVNELTLPESELAPLGVAPFYPRGWYTRTSRLASDTIAEVVGVARLELWRRRAARLFSLPPLRWSFTAGLTWSGIDRLFTARMAAVERAMLATRGARDPQAQGPRLSGDGELERRIVTTWRRSSLQMAALSERLGIPYFHFLQPNQYVPDSKPMDPQERRVAVNEASPVRGAVQTGYGLLREAGEALAADGVAFTDLSGVFRTVSEPVYVDDCCHLGRLGNELLGAAIGRIMARSPALAARP